MKIKLTDIFISNYDKWHFSKQELLALEINVCFINDEQLRPEYKLFFSKLDVIDYLNLVLKAADFDLKNDKVPFPEVGEFFIKK